MPAGPRVISASQTTDPILDPAWTTAEVTLEDLVPVYMIEAARHGRHNHHYLQVHG
jgi:hypothetical protein